ncbi:hypothetical protein CTAM01_11474 [Colletotrichum tamarilloi]|uniref:3-hydroxyisobutyrate dehydrogenase protein n=1 Tax=Colletotrichum tamarilloi TaxID=1209934 RepID=A0ABQ9QY16_9PEZI|nr:uncharacterized protein CTAM01_11474 [Colletotrichum tamarilloi]KAK1488251.1 hypothetical protein CTAM01_11474 [Colletotrichum tamarilloi]
MEPDYTDPSHEWWARPSDGYLVPLVLQCGQEPDVLPETSRWSRLGKLPSRVSPVLRVSYWTGSSLFVPGTRKYNISFYTLVVTALKLLVAWPVLCMLVCWAGNLGTTVQQLVDARNKKDSRYDNVCVLSTEESIQKRPFPGRHLVEQDAILSGPLQEARPPASEQHYTDNIRLSGSLPPSGSRVDSSPTSLRPRYLCFVRDFEQGIYETVKVSDYLAQHGDDVDLEFVFVSYTRLQFRVATEEELNKHDYRDEATRNANKKVARQDREILAKWGMDAAKRVGKRAFWLDFECVRNDDGIARSTSSSQDVYRICDIVRAAHSMIIAIGPSANDKVASILASTEPPEYKRENVTPWLRQWGSRLWTLPELLLCPGEYRIRLYVLGDQAEPKELAKRNFAERAWDDAEAVKELVDHFEGSAILTDLRLIEAALACFSRRQTDQFNKGDIAYATMGLFPNRHRPPVNKEDSGFQAFAKLSIANDSGAFLSRLISLSQPDGAPWHRVEDTWGARLSEIFPSVSITGVVGADTVMLDKVHGATIHWDNLEPEPYFDRSFGMRYVVFVGFTYFACFSVPMAFSFFTGIASIVLSDFMRLSIWQVYMWLLPLAVVFALLFPIVLISTRGRVKQPAKSRLIGIEGIVDSASIEKHLWGFNHGNLSTTNPQHYSDEDDRRDPPTLLQPSGPPAGSGTFAFTLVDTYLMTVTHFHCRIPPVAILECGSEGGLQRTLLCSYDARTNTFHRQAVLRVNRRGVEQLHRIDRIRLSLAPHPQPKEQTHDTIHDASSSSSSNNDNLPVQAQNNIAKTSTLITTSHTWGVEFLFFALCLAGLSTLGPSNSARPSAIFIFHTWSLVGQLPGFILLQYLPLNQVAICTFAANILVSVVRGGTLFHNIAVLLSRVHAILRSCLALTLVKYMITWYPIQELPLRFLFWNVAFEGLVSSLRSLPEITFNKTSLTIDIGGIIFFTNISLLYYTIQVGFSNLIGGPKDVTWLLPHQKLYYSQRAASESFYAKAAGAVWWMHQQSLSNALISFLVFSIALAMSLTSQGFIHEDPVSGAGAVFISILAGLLIYKLPSTLFIIMVSVATTSGLLSVLAVSGFSFLEAIPFQFLWRINEAALPLLWAFMVRQSASLTEALGSVSLSWIGWSVGQIIIDYTDSISTFAAQLPLLMVQSILWALLWVACGRESRIRLPEHSQDIFTASDRDVEDQDSERRENSQ